MFIISTLRRLPKINRSLPLYSDAALHSNSHGGAASRPYCCTSVILDKTGTKSETISKLHGVFANYQRENYKMELPSRFRKEMVKATDKNKDGMISVEEIEALLKQIGASDKLTRAEIEEIMKETGVTEGVNAIPIDQFLKIL